MQVQVLQLIKNIQRGQMIHNMETVIMFTFWFVTLYYVPVYVKNVFSAWIDRNIALLLQNTVRI